MTAIVIANYHHQTKISIALLDLCHFPLARMKGSRRRLGGEGEAKEPPRAHLDASRRGPPPPPPPAGIAAGDCFIEDQPQLVRGHKDWARCNAAHEGNNNHYRKVWKG